MAELIITILLTAMITFIVVLCFVKGAGVALQIVNGIFSIGKDLLVKGYEKLRSKLGLDNA